MGLLTESDVIRRAIPDEKGVSALSRLASFLTGEEPLGTRAGIRPTESLPPHPPMRTSGTPSSPMEQSGLRELPVVDEGVSSSE